MDGMNLIANVATLLTAIATLVAVLEMRRQRRSGYLPRLILDDERIEIRQRGQRAVEIVQDRRAQGTKPQISPMFICIANIGVGAARNLRAEVTHDLDGFASLIASLDRDNDITIDIDRFVQISSSIEGMSESAHNYKLQQESFTKYLLPIEHDPNAVWIIELPLIYVELLRLWAWLEFRERVYATSPPRLKLDVTYQNLLDETENESFDISLKAYLISEHPVESADDRTMKITMCVSNNA